LLPFSVVRDVEIHSVRDFLWRRVGFKEQIMSQIKETYGDGMIHLRSVQGWTHDFAAGRAELPASTRFGRATGLENADRIMEFLESEPYNSQKTLSRRPNLHHDMVHRILTEGLGWCKVNFK
jgi:hypothetical protein